MIFAREPQASSWQLPPAMADTAWAVDSTYNFIFWFSVVFTFAITAFTLYCVVKFRRKKGVPAEPTGHFNRLEIFWTITPTIFIGVLFHTGFSAYIRNVTPTEGATEIRVRARKWSWEFEYPSGTRVPAELTLELGKPYKLILSSEDVLHSFFVPEFRLKRDAVPGQYSFITFTPTEVGEAHIFCAEYCGTSHSAMLGTVKILPAAEYKEFVATQGKCVGTAEECKPEKYGERLFVKNGCTACHGIGGTGKLGTAASPGPRIAGIYNTLQPLSVGAPVTADENYIRESILRPNAKIVAGYTTVQMPAFPMKDDQLDAIIAYIKSLK